jgi:hypothetical protein
MLFIENRFFYLFLFNDKFTKNFGQDSKLKNYMVYLNISRRDTDKFNRIRFFNICDGMIQVGLLICALFIPLNLKLFSALLFTKIVFGSITVGQLFAFEVSVSMYRIFFSCCFKKPRNKARCLECGYLFYNAVFLTLAIFWPVVKLIQNKPHTLSYLQARCGCTYFIGFRCLSVRDNVQRQSSVELCKRH